MQARDRIVALDGLKGLAAFMIMTGHFLGIYKYAAQIKPLSKPFEYAIKGYIPFEIFVNETIWLAFFLVISGFVVSNKQIKSAKQLVSNIIIRFVRLYLPMMFANLFIYSTYKFVGFHSGELSSYLTNEWLTGTYNYKLYFYDIFIQPIWSIFTPSFKMNPVYWTMHAIFYSSVAIYLYRYLKERYLKTSVSKMIVMVALTLIGYPSMKFLWLGCMLGLLLNEIVYGKILKDIRIVKYIALCSCMALCGVHDAVYYFLIRVIELPQILAPNNSYKCIYVFLILIYFIQNRKIQRPFESRIFMFLYNINFGIYSFHFPIICSFGSLVICYLYAKYPIGIVLFCAFLVVTVMTLLLAVVYHLTAEKISDKLLIKIKKML